MYMHMHMSARSLLILQSFTIEASVSFSHISMHKHENFISRTVIQVYTYTKCAPIGNGLQSLTIEDKL